MTAKERQELGEFKMWLQFRIAHHKKNNTLLQGSNHKADEAETILGQFTKLLGG